jgi:site-specific DNA-methyltransferase (adenine-specific)
MGNVFEIHNKDCFEMLRNIKDESVDLVLTDPPYFIDGLGDEWNSNKIKISSTKASVVGGMPVGMKFDKNQSKRFYEFSLKCFNEYLRILKPGGFAISFSQARLYHSMAYAAEIEGFEIRDMLGWCYEGQAKAFSQDHFINKRKDLSESDKQYIIKKLNNRKTPQLKPMIEPMVLAQKTKEGTFVDNFLKYNTGLIDVSKSLNEKFPGNLFTCPKPKKSEFNIHPTVKPLRLIQILIEIFTVEGAIVVDPFLGSGTTAISALKTNRNLIGSELSEEYFKIINKRIDLYKEGKLIEQ